ncbi:conserved hypothetical protein [Agrobacterium deltaense NCPPB 1641]|uniref:Uncharacterized protein n=1 Tax=Agrobacterium deltaense NCPPB 1641 TaxID=1183425 RepID=A0A1S7TLT7_9HYPH|nr:conserved hypothetical protein [Agrobacterium deltaense NCPPB 1641]
MFVIVTWKGTGMFVFPSSPFSEIFFDPLFLSQSQLAAGSRRAGNNCAYKTEFSKFWSGSVQRVKI